MRNYFFSFLLLLTAVLPCSAAYELKEATDANGRNYQYIPGDPFQARFYTLSNGMRLFLSRNTQEPRIQTAIAVRAGAADDPLTSTGLAHYFEHMMFKGNARIASLDWEKEQPLLAQIEQLFEDYRAETNPEKKKKIYGEIDRLSLEASRYSNDEYWTMTQNIGASGVNAYTAHDETVYVSDIPASAIEQFLYLESVRFSGIALRRFHTELETVYEEFNMGQDDDPRLAYQTLMAQLFLRHPYERSVIGLPEHIKAPSMRDIRSFFQQFYRPDNMALILSGDLDYEKTAELAERYFARAIPRNPKPLSTENSPRNLKEAPITEQRIQNITGPEREQLLMGIRVEATPENERMLNLIEEILQNGKCGLFDKDLLLPQKVHSLSQGVLTYRDALLYLFIGEPRQGETLEQLQDKIFEELAKLQRGEFPDWLPEAMVNNMRLSLITASEDRETACDLFVDAFIRNYSLADALNEADQLEKITKPQLMAFAKQHFAPNQFAIVFKRSGTPEGRLHAEKPVITPVAMPEEHSRFFAEFSAMQPLPPPEPVFPDFKKELKTMDGDGSLPENCYWAKNRENERFSLNIVYQAGALQDLRLPLAFGLAPFLGMGGRTAEELQQELYRLAGNVSYSSNALTSSIRISGLTRNREEILALFRKMKWTPDEGAWKSYRNALQKERENAKKDQWNVFQHALRFAAYGGLENLSNLYLPEEELEKLSATELTGFLNRFTEEASRDYVLYAPDCFSISQSTGTPTRLPQKEFLAIPPAENEVYFIHYPMVQDIIAVQILDQASPDRPYLFASIFSEFARKRFWTELRERRALAYSAGASYSNPAIMLKDYSSALAYIITQPDKLTTAVDAMLSEIRNPTPDQELYAASVRNILSGIRNSRIHPENYYGQMKDLERRQLKELPSEIIYRKLPSLTQEEFLRFWKERISGKPYRLIVIGDQEKIDLKKLEKYGRLHTLTLKQIYRK